MPITDPVLQSPTPPDPQPPSNPPEHIMQFFSYEHLTRNELRDVSKMFFILANAIVEQVPRNPERTVALRKLLEAKDAAVRATIAK